LGTDFIQTPQVGRIRALVHFVLCGLTFYVGFARNRGQNRKP
jgi:hypothetical protein